MFWEEYGRMREAAVAGKVAGLRVMPCDAVVAGGRA